MRKLILVSLFALTCIHMQSQITITTADMPQVNDSIKISMCTSIGTLNPALTDTNYVWDYSTLIPTNQTVEHFDNPANFAFPFNLLFNIYNTSYGLFNYTPDSIPGLNIKLSKSYDFYKNSATDLKLIGKGIFINGLPANAPYSADDYVYQFPEQYTKVDSCDYKYGTKIPGQGYYGQKGHRVNTADGWGTVKTPYGTFQALRIKSLLTIIDTIYLDTYHIGFNRPRPLTIQYKWLTKSEKIPVLEIDGTSTNGLFTTTNATYRDSARAGVPQTGILEWSSSVPRIQTYPNPASAFVLFDIQNGKTDHIQVVDVNGKIYASKKINSTSPALDVSLFASGLYFFDLSDAKGQLTGRGKIAVVH
jgi:hypothetical protein